MCWYSYGTDKAKEFFKKANAQSMIDRLVAYAAPTEVPFCEPFKSAYDQTQVYYEFTTKDYKVRLQLQYDKTIIDISDKSDRKGIIFIAVYHDGEVVLDCQGEDPTNDLFCLSSQITIPDGKR